MTTMHERFDKRFDKLRGLRPHLDLEELRQFVQSEIELAVAKDRKRIVEEIEKMNNLRQAKIDGKEDWNMALEQSASKIDALVSPISKDKRPPN